MVKKHKREEEKEREKRLSEREKRARVKTAAHQGERHAKCKVLVPNANQPLLAYTPLRALQRARPLMHYGFSMTQFCFSKGSKSAVKQ
jgi:hypothetical protein